MSDGQLANWWPSTDADMRQSQLVSLDGLGAIVSRIRSGVDTWDDRVALIDIAAEIEQDAPGTELAELADTLRRLAES